MASDGEPHLVPRDLGLPGASLGLVLRRGRDHLAMAGVQDAARDARILMGHAVGADPGRLILDAERMLDVVERDRFAGLIARRANREPVSRILGERGFFGRTFAVTPHVLDPRPDTETLIEETLRIVHSHDLAGSPLRLLDLGTGSGAILLTLLAELPQALGTGIDISEAALACARANAERLGLSDRATFTRGDYRSVWQSTSGAPSSDEGFDIWLSNPPYIATSEIAALDPEVAGFDPYIALDGGPDGRDAYRAIFSAAAGVEGCPMIAPRWIVLEVGAGQGEQVATLARRLLFEQAGGRSLSGFEGKIRMSRDLGGHNRCVSFQLSAVNRKKLLGAPAN